MNTPEVKVKTPVNRVTIAQDVLALLRRKKLTAESGVYCDLKYKMKSAVESEPTEDTKKWSVADMEKVILKNENSEGCFGGGIYVPGNFQLKTLLQIPHTSCRVCGIGALFVSLVTRVNKATLGESQGDDAMRAKLAPYFSKEQRVLIESAFERRECIGSEAIKETTSLGNKVEAAIIFGEKFDNDDDRLKAICKNIIRNGKFDPTPKKKAAK